ncbi:hypothetical protein ACSLVN_27585, partial [Klebsiella pneumoniae]|uniref:hypothetical protein n=1 Tax=Klebsiella pneumoniae TaxID=573 RepID=UPI003EE3E8A8
VLLGNPNRGTPSKTWVTMTPTRYGHCVELLREGKFTPAVIEHATNVINTSSWLKKPIGQVSDADVAALLRDKPWERKTGTAEYAGPQQ